MPGGGGGSQDSTVHQTSLPEYAEPYYKRLMERGEAVSNTPYVPYQGARLSNFTDDTNAYFQGTRDIAAYGNPYLDQAAAATQYGTQAAYNSGNYNPAQFGSTYNQNTFNSNYNPQNYQTQYDATDYSNAGSYDPSQFTTGRFGTEAANQYLNPYTEGVMDRVQRRENENYQQLKEQTQADAVQAGAFGGSRRFVEDAVNQRTFREQQRDTEAQLLNESYKQARDQFNADEGRSLQAQQLTDASNQFGAQFGLSKGRAGDQSRQFFSQLGQQGMQYQDAANQFGDAQRLKAQELTDSSQRFYDQQWLAANQSTEASRQYASQLQQEAARLGLAGAGQLGDIGRLTQEQAFQRLNALNDSGLMQQAFNQQILDIGYGDFIAQRDYERGQLQFLSSLMNGVPISPNSTVTTQQNPNFVSQLAGLGLGLGGLSKAGVI
jgi:hypothetical protein